MVVEGLLNQWGINQFLDRILEGMTQFKDPIILLYISQGIYLIKRQVDPLT